MPTSMSCLLPALPSGVFGLRLGKQSSAVTRHPERRRLLVLQSLLPLRGSPSAHDSSGEYGEAQGSSRCSSLSRVTLHAPSSRALPSGSLVQQPCSNPDEYPENS